MPTKEKQIRKFALVIQALPDPQVGGRVINDFKTIEEGLKDLSVVLPCSYWAILHDMDVKEDTGELKTPHIHLVLDCNTRHTFLGILRKVSEAFGIAQERVSVRETRNQNSAIRYLMHLDDPEKQPYLPFDVITNEKEGLNMALLNNTPELDIETLIIAIGKSENELELARKIGLKNYQRYRATIQDLVPLVELKKKKEKNNLPQ